MSILRRFRFADIRVGDKFCHSGNWWRKMSDKTAKHLNCHYPVVFVFNHDDMLFGRYEEPKGNKTRNRK